jgi:hypothetical protein
MLSVFVPHINYSIKKGFYYQGCRGIISLLGLGKAQGFAFAFKSVGVWGAASPPKVLPLTFQTIYK